MKTRKGYLIAMVMVLAVCMASVSSAIEMGTAFTYQGRLNDGGSPADGIYEMEFKLFGSIADPTQLGFTVSFRSVEVVDGYFTVALDFGSSVFDGDARWLEIGIRPSDTADPFTTLSPRQEITATPYALQTRGIFVSDDYNVGIGTISPLSRLSAGGEGFVNTGVYGNGSDYGVYGNSSTYGVFGRGGYSGVHGRDDDSGSFGRLGYDTYGVYGSGTVFGGYFLGDGYFSGDVGIGMTVPSSRLDIKASNQSSTGGLRVTSSINDNKVIHLQDSSAGDQGLISVRTDGSDKIVLRANGTSYFDGGNVGIGTTSPTSKLQVTGDEVRIGDGGVVNYATGDGDLYVENVLEVDGKIRASNMPGCEYSDFSDYSNAPGAWNTVGSISLTLPEDGYITVTFTGTTFLDGPGIITIGIGVTLIPNDNEKTTMISNNSSHEYIPFCVQHTSYCSVGDGGSTITFYGRASSSVVTNMENMQMTAIYVPVRY